MEMEMSVEMNDTLDRLSAAAGMLEAAVARMSEIEVHAVGSAQALEEKLAAAEAKIAELMARGTSSQGVVRKTLQAKEASGEGLASGIDGALTSLSLEQRIAVKSQLMRAGLLG